MDALRRNPLNAAKLKLVLSRAEMLDLQRKILAGEVVNRVDVERALVARVHAARAAFQSLPRLMASQLVGRTENEIENLLDDGIHTILLELSEQIELPSPALALEAAHE